MNQPNSINHMADALKDTAKDFQAKTEEKSPSPEGLGFVSNTIQKAREAGERALSNADVQGLAGNLRDNLKNYAGKSGDVVAKYPLYTVLGAAAVGAIAGVVIARATARE